MPLIYDESFPAYCERPAINNSALKVYERCPLLYRKAYIDRTVSLERDSDAMLVGRAAHTLILEGEEAYLARYVVRPQFYPGKDKKGKAVDKDWTMSADWCKAWVAEHEAKGLEVLSADENKLVERLALAIEENPDTAAIFEAGRPEITITSEYLGRGVKGRLDWYDPERYLVADLKTVDDLDNFERQVKRIRRGDGKHWYYYRQLAWYRSLMEFEGHTACNYYLVAVEKQEPFRCGTYRLRPKLLGQGESENDGVFRDLLASLTSNHWAGNPCGVQEVELPEDGHTFGLAIPNQV